MEEKEEWKLYYKGPKVTWEVSSFGNVKRNGVLVEPRINNNGYLRAGRFFIHRMVAICFIPNPEKKLCIDHINCIKTDNRVTNLRWCTNKENSNNPITRKRIIESMKGKNKGRKLGPPSECHRKRISESMKGKNKDTHRVYHDDGTWHMEKNTQYITTN